MENNSNTVTVTDNSEVKTEEKKENIIHAKSAVFLMFAELMGYVSPLIEWANDMCDGKLVSPCKEKFIKIDAINIFRQMRKDFDDNLLRENWTAFYDTVLEDYENNVLKIETDSLPF